MSFRRRHILPRIALPLALVAALGFQAAAQAAPAAPPSQPDALGDSIRDLQQQIHALQSAVAEIRSEAAHYRSEAQEMRRELEATRAQIQPAGGKEIQAPPRPGEPVAAQNLADRVAQQEEEIQLLAGKVDDQFQTKVETASKYRVRLSGILLFNLFENHGRVDNMDIPSWASPVPSGTPDRSVGATLRQSQVGLEVFGPHVAGAKTSADVQFDFAGGFPGTINGVNTGIMRLRTGTARIDWADTSVVAGQDGLFFSPLTPTSFASLSTPALSYAGNLWGWTPQLRVEHRFSLTENSKLVVQAGILDSLSGDIPPNAYVRSPQAGESSGQPAYAVHIAWASKVFDQPLSFGVGGYYGRQNYGNELREDGWAGTADWSLPLAPRVSVSGEFFRGRAIGGLGGGIGRSVLFGYSPTGYLYAIQPLNAIGGWSQLKVRATRKLEFNAAAGQDNPYAADLRALPGAVAYVNPSLARNQGWLANMIYRPRSDLLFAGEYHHLRTSIITDDHSSANQIGVTMGVLF